jgi:hypothetical protein
MDLLNIFNLFFLSFASDVDFTAPVETATSFLPLDAPFFVIASIILIVVTIFILFFLKKIITNSIMGLVVWGIAIYGFNIPLPFIPSLIISIVIGPAGIGAMILLNAFGLLVI